MIPITVEQLMKATGAKREHAELYLPFLQGTCKAYGITTPRSLSGFLSQIGHESQGLSTVEEDLNYSVDGLLKTFGRHRISEINARRYGRTAGQPANQQMIANHIYGGDWGLKNLGNVQFGDGWKHRGMGLKQLTGLANHRACGIALGENFVDFPERLLMPVNAALSAGWFWSSRGLNSIAERGDVKGMTKVINGGANGLEQRAALWDDALRVFA